MTTFNAARAFTAVVLRALVRDRTALFFILVLPVIVIVIIGATFGGQQRIELPVLDADGSTLSAQVVTELRSLDGVRVHTERTLDAVQKAVRRSAPAGLVLPRGFGAAVETGHTARVELVAAAASEAALTARIAIQGALDRLDARFGAAQLAVQRAGGSFASRLAVATSLQQPRGRTVRIETVGGAGSGSLSRFSLVAPQNLVLFVFINSMASAALIVAARRNGILRRALATRTGALTIVVGLGAGWLVFALVQSLLIIGVGALLFGVRWGDPAAAALLVVTFALVGCGAGLLVGALGRNEDRVGAITPIIGIVLGALGGCMVPLEVFPPAMLAIAHAIPHYWAISAWQSLVIDGEGLGSILGRVAVLLGFGIALTGVATVALHRNLTGA